MDGGNKMDNCLRNAQLSAKYAAKKIININFNGSDGWK
jgi:hypothetical protein